MNVAQFIAKWEKVELTESSAAQQHFLDLCEVVEHPKPAAADPTAESFTFERGATKHGGGISAVTTPAAKTSSPWSSRW